MKFRVLALLIFLSFVMGIVECAEAVEPWVTVGSAGTVDEEDLGQVDLNDSFASIKSAVLSGTVEIRYNLLDPPSLPAPLTGLTLTAIFVDRGEGSRVIARLRGVNTATGVETDLVTVDSNLQQPSNEYQRLTRNSCEIEVFNSEAFYLDVVLSKRPGGTPPKILALRVDDIGCPPPRR